MTWAAKHGVSCASISGNANLQKCTDVPATAQAAATAASHLAGHVAAVVGAPAAGTGVLVREEYLSAL